jgi:AcrR family transcriptional regulator
MEPLRERKKEQTRARILEVAARLLGERGLEAATMEEIAAAAEVSVGTLYNYFGSKTLLLLALYEQETTILIARGAAIVADPGDDGPAAAQRLFAAYLDVFLDHLDRSLLTDAFTAGMTQAALGGKLMDLDLQLMEQVGQLVHALRTRGVLDLEVAPEEATLLLYSLLITQILFYVTVPAVEPGVVRAQLARQVEAAFAGLGPDPTNQPNRA